MLDLLASRRTMNIEIQIEAGTTRVQNEGFLGLWIHTGHVCINKSNYARCANAKSPWPSNGLPQMYQAFEQPNQAPWSAAMISIVDYM